MKVPSATTITTCINSLGVNLLIIFPVLEKVLSKPYIISKKKKFLVILYLQQQKSKKPLKINIYKKNKYNSIKTVHF